MAFFVRALGVINSHDERGAFAYVQMLNISMPVVKTQVYKEDAYSENKLSAKAIALEALGLANVNLVGIIGNEISYFSGAKMESAPVSDHSSGFTKFQVNEKTIAKLTPEEIAELNDVSKAYKPSLKKTLAAKPEVLIYSTHSMEHYAESDGQTTNTDYNVVGVGDILAKELEEGYGISVVHDRTNYSASYNDAYDRSREGLQKYLSEYGSFKLVIDLHRDSASRNAIVTNLNNQSLAKFMFVTSQNVPTYDANQKIVDDLEAIGKNLFPEIIKPTKIFEGRGGINGFNQGFNEGSMIIEVGSHEATAQEAKLTSKYIARIIAEYLNGGQ
ncbi:MAG: stage II sporulation protein P [Clostridium sp.]